jgi:hypothetical protein
MATDETDLGVVKGCGRPKRREWDGGRGDGQAFQERRSQWLGCFGKSETLSGSRLTARGRTRHEQLRSPNVRSLPSSYLPLLHSPIHTPQTLHSSSLVFFCRSYTSSKWVPFRKSTPTSPSRPSPSSSSLVSLLNTPSLPYENWGQLPCGRVNG